MAGWLPQQPRRLQMQKSHGSTFPPLSPTPHPRPPLSSTSRSQPDPRVHPVFAEASKWRWISTACRGFDDDTPLKRKTGARAPLADELIQWDFDTANCGWVSSLGALKSPCGCLALCPESRCGRFIHPSPPSWLADSQLNIDSRQWHTSKSVSGIRSVPCALAELCKNQLKKCHQIIFHPVPTCTCQGRAKLLLFFTLALAPLKPCPLVHGYVKKTHICKAIRTQR